MNTHDELEIQLTDTGWSNATVYLKQMLNDGVNLFDDGARNRWCKQRGRMMKVGGVRLTTDQLRVFLAVVNKAAIAELKDLPDCSACGQKAHDALVCHCCEACGVNYHPRGYPSSYCDDCGASA